MEDKATYLVEKFQELVAEKPEKRSFLGRKPGRNPGGENHDIA